MALDWHRIGNGSLLVEDWRLTGVDRTRWRTVLRSTKDWHDVVPMRANPVSIIGDFGDIYTVSVALDRGVIARWVDSSMLTLDWPIGVGLTD